MPENANSDCSEVPRHNFRTIETIRNLIRLMAQSVAKAIAQSRRSDMVKPMEDRQ